MRTKNEKTNRKSGWKAFADIVVIILFALWIVPEQKIPNPVEGCGNDSYDHQTFWYPWGDHYHRGIDIFADLGTPVRSATDGFVVKVGHAENGTAGGNFVEILGRATRSYYYAHLNEIDPQINLGKFVRQGQIIGTVGKTGNANRPDCPTHCHFSIHTWIPQFQNGFAPIRYHKWDLVEKFFYVNPIIAMGDSIE